MALRDRVSDITEVSPRAAESPFAQISAQGLPEVLRHRVSRHPHRFDGEVGVTRRGLDLRVPEQLADHGQALARGDGRGREGVAQVVDADVLHAGAGADALPEGLEIAQALAGQGAGDDPRVAFDALGVAQQVDGGLAEMDDLGAGLRIRQAQDALSHIDVCPFQRHDLV